MNNKTFTAEHAEIAESLMIFSVLSAVNMMNKD